MSCAPSNVDGFKSYPYIIGAETDFCLGPKDAHERFDVSRISNQGLGVKILTN